jgi:hypothetical protein
VFGLMALGLGALIWCTGLYFDRMRRQELGEALSRLGLAVGSPLDARFVHRQLKGQRGFEGKFWSHGTALDQPLEVAEFTFKTGRGKHTQTHRNMQVSRPSPPPHRWPELRLSKKVGFMRRSLLKLGEERDFGLENEAFGKRWTIECEDKDFAVLLLSPIIQDWLMLAPKDESWALAEGRVCLTRTRKCRATDVEAMITRLDEFLAMVPDELAAYEAGQRA